MSGNKCWWMLAACMAAGGAQAQGGSEWSGITVRLGQPPAFAALVGAPAALDEADQPGLNLALTISRDTTQLDWHPLGSGFRLSGAMRAQALEPLLSPRAQGSLRPYLGLGWGEHWGERLSLNLDVGVMLPGTGLSAAPGEAGAAYWRGGLSGLRLEQGGPWSYDPLFQVGLDYSF